MSLANRNMIDVKHLLDDMFSDESTNPGKLITVSGFDGAGKSTQIKMLVENYRTIGKSVLQTFQPTFQYRKHPDVRRFLTDGKVHNIRNLALLAAADRLRHVEDVIKPALREGQIVICDRYVYESLVLFTHRGISLTFLTNINKGIPRPDHAIFLDVPSKILAGRLKKRDGDCLKFEERSVSTIEKINARYKVLKNYMHFVTGDAPSQNISRDIFKICSGNPVL